MNISKKMQDAFNAQITAELYSSNLYLGCLSKVMKKRNMLLTWQTLC